MSTAVLIPYRGGCPHRMMALTWVLTRYAQHPWPVVIGHCPDGRWIKAAAVGDALEQTGAAVLVIADADVWTDGLPEAVAAVLEGAAWAVPHRSVHRLPEASTRRYMAGEALDGLELAERPYRGFEGGGVTVVRRDVYEDCPMDSRFEGWGCEDDSWGMALRTLHGPPWRPTLHVPLVHLWHPSQERATRSFGNLAGRELRKRYARAENNRAAMRALVGEHRLLGVEAWRSLTY